MFVVYCFFMHVGLVQGFIILVKMRTHGAEFSVYANGRQNYFQNYPVLPCWEGQQWNSMIRSRSFSLFSMQCVKFHRTFFVFVYRLLLMSNTKHLILNTNDTFWTCVSSKSPKVQIKKHQLTAVSRCRLWRHCRTCEWNWEELKETINFNFRWTTYCGNDRFFHAWTNFERYTIAISIATPVSRTGNFEKMSNWNRYCSWTKSFANSWWSSKVCTHSDSVNLN